MIPIDQLFQAQTKDEVREQLLSLIETVGVPARSWRKGGALSTILTYVAALIAALTAVMVTAIRSMFLDTSEGFWLTQLAYYVYGVTRIDATFATGKVSFTNTSATTYTKQIGEVRVFNPTTKKTYTNTEIVTIPGLAVDVRFAFQAVEQGSASSSASASVTSIETTMLGVTCTNPDAIVGSDPESDADLRQACRDKTATLSPNGPRAAYAYFARRTKRIDGSAVDINRVTVTKDSSVGVVTVYLASPSGAPVGSDVTAVADNLYNNCVPDGQRADVFAATPVTLSLPSVVVYARKESGQTAEALKAGVLAALVALQRDYPIGGLKKGPGLPGYLFGDKISGVITGSSPAIFDVDGVGSDLLLTAGQVASINATVTVNLVSGAS